LPPRGAALSAQELDRDRGGDELDELGHG
jgi:hypothetical protein